MKLNKENNVALICIPGNGAGSVARSLGLSEVSGVEPDAFPAVARKQLGDAWRDLSVFAIVRDPVARFESLATWLFSSGPREAYTDELNQLIVEGLVQKPAMRGASLLAFIKKEGFDNIPRAFLPQSKWLTCKIDTILRTSDIAEYFNKVVGRCCLRLNARSRNPEFSYHRVTADVGAVAEVYADDYELFSKLRVWSPKSAEVRLVSGPCKSCQKAIEEGKQFISGDEIQEDADDSDVAEKLHVRAKGPRKRSVPDPEQGEE